MSFPRGIAASGWVSDVSETTASPARAVVEDLEKRLPALSEAESRELASLGQETDAEIFWTDLLRLGGKLEARDKLDSALSIYSLAASKAPPELIAKAQGRLDSVEGRGAIGSRFEFHLRRFAHDAFNPEMIVPMMAGSAVYGLTRGLALGRFATTVNSAWWMRGAAGRISAASLGYAAEVPAFVLTSRAMRLSHPKGVEPGLGQEFASAAITLGLLKTSGALSQSLLQKYGGQPSPALRFAAGQGTMFAGLASAHAIEEGLGLRPHVEGATAFTDILASMVSLGIGANLGRRLLGPGHEAMSREFQARMQAAGESFGRLAALPSRELATEFGPTQLWMSSESGDSKGRPRSPHDDFRPFRLKNRRKKPEAVHSFDYFGALIELRGRAGSETQLKMLGEDLLDLLIDGAEGQQAFQGRIVERLRNEPELRSRILRPGNHVRLDWEPSERRLLRLQLRENGKIALDLGLRGEELVTRRGRRTESKPKVAEPPVDLLTFNGRSAAFLTNLEVISGFRDPDAAFAKSTIEALIEGKGMIPTTEYRWEVLEAFEERLKRGEGATYEELRNHLWRKSKDAEVSQEFAFHRPQPMRRVALDLFDMSQWSPEWAEVRSLANEMFSQIEAKVRWRQEMKDGYIRGINDILGEFGPTSSTSTPQKAKIALGQMKKYSDDIISYPVFRRSVMDIRKYGEVRTHQQKPNRVEKQELSPPSEVANSLTMVLKTFEYFAERQPSWKEAVSQFRGRYEELARTEPEGIWQDRLVDLMDRAMEMAESDSSFTAPKAQRWLEAFEASRRGEMTWENFEAIDPKSPISRPRVVTPPPKPDSTIPGPVPPVSVGPNHSELEALKIENSIKSLSAEVLIGDLAAIEALGAAARSRDLAVWELREIFEMTWQQEIKPEDFGGHDLIRLREKIGAALRHAAKENPFAKRILGQLQQVFGFASLIEAPPPVPMAKTPPPPSEPPVLPSKATVAKTEIAAIPLIPAPPKIRIPKKVLTPTEKIEQTIQKALTGSFAKILSHEVTDQLIKDLEAMKPEDLVNFATTVSEHYDSKPAAELDQRELYLYYAVGVLVSRSRGLNFVDPILVGKASAQSTGKPREFSNFVQGLSRRLIYKAGSQDLFKVRSADSLGVAELRRQMKATIKIKPDQFQEGREAQSHNFKLAQALGVHEAERLREELILSLHYLYRQTMIAKQLDLLPQAKEYQKEIAVEMVVLLGLVVNRTDSTNTAAIMRRLGVSINEFEPGTFYFHPFPEEYTTTIKIKLPPLDLGAAKLFFEPLKK